MGIRDIVVCADCPKQLKQTKRPRGNVFGRVLCSCCHNRAKEFHYAEVNRQNRIKDETEEMEAEAESWIMHPMGYEDDLKEEA